MKTEKNQKFKAPKTVFSFKKNEIKLSNEINNSGDPTTATTLTATTGSVLCS